jgi:hypothetical protein
MLDFFSKNKTLAPSGYNRWLIPPAASQFIYRLARPIPLASLTFLGVCHAGTLRRHFWQVTRKSGASLGNAGFGPLFY